ncbi:MAG: M14-type cytosolic carboxypeptidase [Clostridia bacterium]|jgi:hypothetical protein|nr:M14-type cytosolic carboxypeptidase [Clostridia bacterium]
MGKCIESNFEGGSIEYIENDDKKISLSLEHLEKDKTNHWFNFKVEKDFEDLVINIENAHLTGFWRGWEGYAPYISKDGVRFERTVNPFNYKYEENDDYRMGTLSLELNNVGKGTQLAWYKPYTIKDYEKYMEKVDSRSEFNVVNHKKGFKTVEYISSQEAETLMFIGRQHPGETMSSFFMEGIINKCIEIIDKFKNKNIIIAPFVNMSGAIAGKQRTDIDGVDYNRAWNRGDIPNINVLKTYIKNYNVTVFGDIHGDEVDKDDFMYVNPETTVGKNRKICESIVGNIEGLKLKPMLTKNQAIKNAIANGKVYIPNGQTASRFVEENNGFEDVFGFIYEISAHSTEPKEAYKQGEKLIEAISLNMDEELQG